MIDTADFKTNMRITVESAPHQIIHFQHVKPGKGGAFVKTKLRNLISGAVIDRTFRAGEKFDKPDVSQRRMQYLYSSDGEYHFMDSETFDQYAIQAEVLGDATKFMKENIETDVLVYEGRPLTVELPQTVDVSVEECPPAFKGDTAQGSGKPATVETGAVVMVPYFINQGDVIRVDTTTGKYVTRV